MEYVPCLVKQFNIIDISCASLRCLSTIVCGCGTELKKGGVMARE